MRRRRSRAERRPRAATEHARWQAVLIGDPLYRPFKVSVRSAGTSPNARHPVSASDLTWAQVVFVMEEKHKSRLFSEYRRLVENLPIHVLDIPDEYKYMDPELVELLSQSVGAILHAPDGP